MRAAVALIALAIGCGAPESSVAPAPARAALPVASFPDKPAAKPAAKPGRRAKKEDPLFPSPRKPGGWKALASHERSEAHKLADEYVEFLSAAKTPRRAVAALVDHARAAGATEVGARKAGALQFIVETGGDAAVFFRAGSKPVSDGINIVVVSVDAPRIELKQKPLATKADLAMLETRVHGRLELRSWMVHPLALDLHLVRRDGREVSVRIGEAPGDPVLSIPDLLPHLSRGSQRRGKEVTDAERLDALGALGERALRADLKRRGLSAVDFTIAESALVPASRVRRVGVDRALVGGYGQSNRAMAFAAVRALGGISSTPARAAAVVVLGRTDDGGDGGSGYAYVQRALLEVLESVGGAEADLRVAQISLSASSALVATTTAEGRGRGVMLDAVAADTLPQGFRRAVETFEAARVSTFFSKKRSSSEARDIATLDVDAISFAIASSGRGTPGGLVSVYDLYQGARACTAWLASP